MRMVRFCTVVLTTIALSAAGAWAQEKAPDKKVQGSAQAASEAAAQVEKSGATIRSGTRISAELITAVDSRTAKPGQEVVAKVTKDVKQDGKKVVHKGDKLVGTVQSVDAGAAGSAGSQLGVTFDRLVQGESPTQLSTVLRAIVSTPREERERMAEPAPVAAPAPAPAPAPSGGSGGGGLVGGVTSTAGSVVGGATSAVGGVGSTVGATTQSTAGAAAGAGLATPARMIHINSGANAQSNSSASSMLSTKQGHLMLESGTQMEFRVAANADAQAKKPEAPAKKQ